jgi:hypothetical protein
VAAHIDRVVLTRLRLRVIHFLVVVVVATFFFFFLVICELVGDLLVGTLDARGEDLRGVCWFDQDGLTDSDHAPGGVGVDVSESETDMECHVGLDDCLIGFIDCQGIFFDTVTYLLSFKLIFV